MYIVKNCLLKKGENYVQFSKAYINNKTLSISKAKVNDKEYFLGDIFSANVIKEAEIEKTISAPVNYMELQGICKQKNYEGYNQLMFPYSGLPNKNGGATTIDGITYTVTKEGEITLEGEATNDSVFFLVSQGKKITLDVNENYILAGLNKKSTDDNYYMGIQEISYKESWIVRENNYIQFVPKYLEYYAFIKVKKGSKLSGKIIKPLIIKGTDIKEFEPYVGGKPSPSKEYKQDISFFSGSENSIMLSGVGEQGLSVVIPESVNIGGENISLKMGGINSINDKIVVDGIAKTVRFYNHVTKIDNINSLTFSSGNSCKYAVVGGDFDSAISTHFICKSISSPENIREGEIAICNMALVVSCPNNLQTEEEIANYFKGVEIYCTKISPKIYDLTDTTLAGQLLNLSSFEDKTKITILGSDNVSATFKLYKYKY